MLIDDKLRLLSAVKERWQSRVTTIFVRQGHYATDPQILGRYPPADITIACIGDLRNCDLVQVRAVGAARTFSND